MEKVKRDLHNTQLYFRCPGCMCLHAFNDGLTILSNVNPENPSSVPVWEFNGDFEKPTINPSYLSWSYEKNPATKKYDIETDRCHSFIRDGKIQFLSDCHHELAGQTVELPEL